MTLTNILKSFLFEDTPSPEAGHCSLPDSPRDCVLVIDASGSMFGADWLPTRLDGAKAAAIAFAKRLCAEQPCSRLGIVTFGCQSKTIRRLTPAGNLDSICRKIRQIDDGGGTNMYSGLQRAHDLLRHSADASQIVLLTDGCNTGKNPIKLADKLKKKAVIECVGIGGSPDCVDEALLKEIASASPDGAKRYRWIGRKEQLVKHFHRLAGGIRRAQQ